jgi:L-malate glycosyltransferase
MRVNFLLPCYCWVPSGGFRIVYEYANRLVDRGHSVTVVHPRRLAFPPPEKFTMRQRLRRIKLAVRESLRRPQLYWHSMDTRVNLEYVPRSSEKYLPEADVVFATAWHTVKSVLALSPRKGRKCYLIQGYETFLGPRELVEDTWRAPLHKVVIAKWLAGLAKELRAGPVTCIPNAVNHEQYRLTAPLEGRPPRVAMAISPVPVKASRDGVQALEIVKKSRPELQVILFGAATRPEYLPDWMVYLQNPAQESIVRNVYNQSRIYVSPSLSEGFPLPPAEAACCGCAIAATDIGGMKDYVEHGVSGLLSPPADPQALAKNILKLISDEPMRIHLANAARRRVQQFTWSQSTDRMESFLHRILTLPDDAPDRISRSSRSEDFCSTTAGVSHASF